jgi:hypothetical protein
MSKKRKQSVPVPAPSWGTGALLDALATGRPMVLRDAKTGSRIATRVVAVFDESASAADAVRPSKNRSEQKAKSETGFRFGVTNKRDSGFSTLTGIL